MPQLICKYLFYFLTVNEDHLENVEEQENESKSANIMKESKANGKAGNFEIYQKIFCLK